MKGRLNLYLDLVLEDIESILVKKPLESEKGEIYIKYKDGTVFRGILEHLYVRCDTVEKAKEKTKYNLDFELNKITESKEDW